MEKRGIAKGASVDADEWEIYSTSIRSPDKRGYLMIIEG